MADIIYRLVDMPHSVKATVTTSPDGCYNVYINARYNHIQQQQAADHEMRHIEQDHLFRDSDVSVDEAEAELNPISIQSQSNPAPPQYAHLRSLLGYKAYQVAKMVGISTGRYVRIEQGLSQPMPDELESIEKFYSNKGVDI